MKRVVDGGVKALVAFAFLLCSGCAVVAVADAAVTVAATVVKTSVQVTGAVIGAVLPNSKEE